MASGGVEHRSGLRRGGVILNMRGILFAIRRIFGGEVTTVMSSEQYNVSVLVFIYVTRFAKVRLIAGERNCSSRPFLSAKSIFVDFLFSSKIKKNMTLLQYIHIAGELSKD